MSGTQRSFVVSAAAGGIGGELVGRLLATGHRVLACDISSRRLAALSERFSAHQNSLVTHKADVADEASANRIAEIAIDHFDIVHGLANVAGGIAGIGEDVIDRSIERIGLEEMRQTFRLNVDSAFLLSKAFVPAFKTRRYGKIVNVASLAAFGNFDHMGNAAYDAAKAAVIGLTRTLSRSLGSDGIRVNVVAPGSIYTERVREVFSQEFLDTQIARIPLRRMPGPNDVAALIEFLLQPESDQISGEVVRVAGGLR
jgi:NAD(P)-dependent dehydrogenase (short-subunit alcohol dehydrogenase family)